MSGLSRVQKKSAGGGIFGYKARGAVRWGFEFNHPLTGKRKRKVGFLTHNAALAEKESVLRQRAGLQPVKADAKSFKDAVADYLRYQKTAGRKTTSYDALEMWWVPAFGGMAIGQITTAQISETLNALEEEHHWSPATRNNRLAQLSGLFSYAMSQEPPWVIVHPTSRRRIPRSKVENGRERWLTTEEMAALCANCPAWLEPIVRFGAATGWRRGEIAGVKKRDYVVDRNGGAWLYLGKTKNGKPLRTPLVGWVAELVNRQVEACQSPEARIFPGPAGGNPVSEIRRSLPKAIKAAGLISGRADAAGVTFHTLRHTMASQALQAGVTEREVMELGNWTDHRMVRRYSHLADNGRRDAAALVAGALAPAVPPTAAPAKLRAVK